MSSDTARQTGASILLGLILATALIASAQVELPSGVVHPARGFGDSYQVVTVPFGLSDLFAGRDNKLSQVPTADAVLTAGPVPQEPGWTLDSIRRRGHRATEPPHVTSSSRASNRLRTSGTAKPAKARGADTTSPRARKPTGDRSEGRQPRKPSGRRDVSVTSRPGVRRDGADKQGHGAAAVVSGSDQRGPRGTARGQAASAVAGRGERAGARGASVASTTAEPRQRLKKPHPAGA